jgi:hypothetical protein
MVVQRWKLLGGVVFDYFITHHPLHEDLSRGSRKDCCCGSRQESDKSATEGHLGNGRRSTDEIDCAIKMIKVQLRRAVNPCDEPIET